MKEGNLRGAKIRFVDPATGTPVRGTVITHIRGTRWQVESSRLSEKYRWWDGSRRILLDRWEFALDDTLKGH